MSKLVRIAQETYIKLDSLAKYTGLSKQRVLEVALEKLKREKLMESANKAYDQIAKDPKAWQEEQKERALWETTLLDGLHDE